MNKTLCFIGAMTALMLASCTAEQPPIVPEREVVRALWDPTTGTLPTPTDLVKDPQTGLLKLPLDAAMPLAEQEFRRYLNTLDGYPVTSTGSIPVSGPIDVATLPGTVVMVNLETGRRLDVDVAFNEETLKIEVVPRNDTVDNQLQPGQSYAVGLWGYDGGLKDMDGNGVVADAAFFFVRSPENLNDHVPAMPGATTAEKQATAEQLEVVRTSLDPLLDRVSLAGIDRENIAVVSSFTTSGRPSIWFDSATSQVPVPNDLLFDRQANKVTLPANPNDDENTKHIKKLLNAYDGFSTTGAITIKASAPVDPQKVQDPKNIRVFLVKDSEIIEHTDLNRGVLQDGQTMWVQPKLALEHNAEYVYVVSRDLTTTTGANLEAQPIGAMLRFESPLIVDGKPQVSALDSARASLLEPRRLLAKRVVDKLTLEGIQREHIAAAVPFKTVSSVEMLMNLRARLYKENLRTDIVNTLEASPTSRGLLLVMPSVRTIVTGKMTVLDHLDAESLAWREDGKGEERLVDFTLTIPRQAEKGKPVPVVVFGHGLETSRELLYLIAEKLAQNGFAAISMDLPLHGERSVCLRDSNCKDGGTCNERHECILPDGSKGEMQRIKSPWPNGPSYPITSGEPFIDIKHIDAARDHFIQAIMDMCQLVRVVRQANWEKATGGYVLDGQDMVYLGMSLGGILGSNLSVVEPTIGTFVLNVPGGGFLDMVQASAAFRSLFDDELKERGILEGSDEFFRFVNGARWIVDPVDPVNIAHHAIQDPIRYVDPVDGQEKVAPVKRVMIQMAKNDSVVPNISTRILSERMQVPYITYEPSISNHAFLFDPTSGEGRRARNDMIEFFEQR